MRLFGSGYYRKGARARSAYPSTRRSPSSRRSPHGVAVRTCREEQLGELVADRLLDEATQRTGAVQRVVAAHREPQPRPVRHLQREPARRETVCQLSSWMSTIDSSCSSDSGSKTTTSSSRLTNSGLNADRTAAITWSRSPRTEVGGEDQDGVAEVDRAPLAVGERGRRRAPAAGCRRRPGAPSRPRRTAHVYGRRRTASVSCPPDRSRRSREGTDEPSHECFSLYSDMSMRTIARSSSNRKSANPFASSVLPTPVGRGTGTIRWAGSDRRRRPGRGAPRPTRLHRFGLPDDPLGEFGLHAQQLGGLALHHAAGGDAVHAATTSATSSGPTSSLSMTAPSDAPSDTAAAASSCFSSSGIRP